MPSSKRVTGNLNFWTGNSQVYTYRDLSTGFANATVRRGDSNAVFFSSNLEVFGNVVSHGYVYGNGYYLTGVGNGTGGSGGGQPIPSVHFDVTANGVGQTFSNVNLGYYLNNPQSLSVYINGAYQSPGNYSISGTTLTINSSLISGDSVDVGASGGAYGNNNVQNFLTTYTGNISSAGQGANIFANYYYPNGTPFTGSGTFYSNANVQSYLPTYTGNLVSLTGAVTTTANVSGAFILGNGRFLTGLPASYSNANVANYLPVYTGNIQSGNLSVTTTAAISGLLTVGTANAAYVNVDGTLTAVGNITTSANLQGNYVLGNGAFLTGIAGSTYGNADVANYLPAYGGNILIGNANVTGAAVFANVSDLIIPGGTVGQYLQTDGNGNVAFADVSATPGNAASSIQYNYEGNSIRGIDDFNYNYEVYPQNLQLANIGLVISRSTGTTGNNDQEQLTVVGNATITTYEEQYGYLNIGGIDRLQPQDLFLTNIANYAGYAVVVSANGNQLDYGVAARNVWSNANAYIAVSGANTADVKFSLGANFIQLISSGNTSNITVGSNTANVTIDFARPVISSIVTGNASQIVIGGNAIQPNVDLATTSVNAASYGSANTVATFTVDAYGRLTMAANTPISITASQISDLSASLSGAAANTPATVKTLSLTIGGTTYQLLAQP